MTETLRPYIHAGDFVRTEDNMTGDIQEGIVALDDEGTLRVNGQDGANVNARWINVLSWVAA